MRLGYIPRGYSVDEAAEFRQRDPAGYENAVLDSMVEHVRAMLAYQKDGTVTFDYGNNLRGQVADRRGMAEAFEIRGFVPLFIRPLFCKGSGPFRWAALSGNPHDIAVTDDAVLELFGHKEDLAGWMRRRPTEGPLSRASRPDLLARIRRAGGDGRAIQLARGQAKKWTPRW